MGGKKSKTRRVSPGHWTKERCLSEARKHKTRASWMSCGSYKAACVRGWLDECCSHMKDNGYTYGISRPEVLVRETLALLFGKEFVKIRPEWLRRTTSPLELDGLASVRDRLVAFEYNSRYWHGRPAERRTDRWKAKRCQEEGVALLVFSDLEPLRKLKPPQRSTLPILVDGYDLECVVERIAETAHAQLPTELHGAMQKTLSRQLLKGLARRCRRMIRSTEAGYLWTEERLLASARRFSSSSEWQRNDPSAFATAGNRGLRAKCQAHMKRLVRRKWTKAECIAEARKYDSPSAWKSGNSSSYNSAVKRPLWLRECTSHMTRLVAKRWSNAAILREARRYTKLSDWRKSSPGSYQASKKRGIHTQCIRHMTRHMHLPWTKDACIKTARGFGTTAAWAKGSLGSYKAAKREGWFEECLQHLSLSKRGAWTFEEMRQVAARYSSKGDFLKKDKSTYSVAYARGWLPQLMTIFGWTSYIPSRRKSPP